MSLGTSFLKPDGVNMRKHKLVDEYPSSCGVSPKRILVSNDSDRREQYRATLASHAVVKQNVRICALTIGSLDMSNILAQSGADILLCRRKPEGGVHWKLDSAYDVSVLETGESTRLALRSSRIAVVRLLRFERTSDLLVKQANEALLGDAFFRSSTFGYLREMAVSRAAVVELRDTYTGAHFVVCTLDTSGLHSEVERLPIRVVETCALLNEAQKMAGNGQSTVLLFVGDDDEVLFDGTSCWSLFDEIVQFGYPNSDSITQLQRIRMHGTGNTQQHANDASQGALIDALWHFFQHSVVGLRCAQRAQRRFQLWFAPANLEATRFDVNSADYAVIDLNTTN